jgi:hypothetical protein
MAYHFRSQSEHCRPQLAEQPQQQSIIRVYTDSQQSLDNLFNPPPTATAVPLRCRNLPQSFFNPSAKLDDCSTNRLHFRSTSYGPQTQCPVNNNTHRPAVNCHLNNEQPTSSCSYITAPNNWCPSAHQEPIVQPPCQSVHVSEHQQQQQQQHQQHQQPLSQPQPQPQPQPTNNFYGHPTNNLHSRSMSFDQHRTNTTGSMNNFHVRTQSTLAPMRINQNQPLYHRELRTDQSATGWSSSGYSSDDITANHNGLAPEPQPIEAVEWQSVDRSCGSTLGRPHVSCQPTEQPVSPCAYIPNSNNWCPTAHQEPIIQPPCQPVHVNEHQQAASFYCHSNNLHGRSVSIDRRPGI